MKKIIAKKTYEEPWTLPESIFDGLDEALQPDDVDETVVETMTEREPSFFTDKGEPLGEWIPKQELAFIKFMVEDPDFFFQVYPLINQNWFSVPELRDIVRTMKDLHDDGVEVTYRSLSEEMVQHYDLADLSKEISWGIITGVLEDCQGDECLDGFDRDWYEKYFIDRLIIRQDDVDSKEWC